MKNPIAIEVIIQKPIDEVWMCFNNPQNIINWNFAHESWCCPSAENDLRKGGSFKYRMEAKDQSFGFDLKGIYDEVIPHEKIQYNLEDQRKVIVYFEEIENTSTKITEIFEPESENPIEMQEQGWLSILTNFKNYTEKQ